MKSLDSPSGLDERIGVGGRWLILAILNIRNDGLILLLSVMDLQRLLRSVLEAVTSAGARSGVTLVVLVASSTHGDDLDASNVGRDP